MSNNSEFVQMMVRCREEIITLRNQIARLEPKAEAYDNIATVLRLLPRESVGMGEDLVWLLNKRIRDLEAKATAEGSSGAAQ